MAVLEISPLVAIDPIADANNAWVALSIRMAPGADPGRFLQPALAEADLLEVVAPLNILLVVDELAALTPQLLERVPVHRVGFIAAPREGDARIRRNLAEAGYRIWSAGAADALAAPAGTRHALDCHAAAPATALNQLHGPHLGYAIASAARKQACLDKGVAWFAGDYPYDPEVAPDPDEASGSRRRIMTLLALLARDADSYELEQQIRQDPTLAYHLLRLVNSAAFAVPTEITSFGQAITVLGRRQLQRWLQLLLYARQQPEGMPNLLLPLAARRGVQLESLCRAHGGDHDAQDQAYMAGVFSLLEHLLQMPLSEIIASLCLPEEVSAALLRREGRLGQWLALCERHPQQAELEQAGVSLSDWWRSQLQGYRWAIQVGRNV